MNGTVSVPVFVPEDISVFFLRDQEFYRDTARDTDRSKYELLIKSIHIGPHRDSDRWETRRNHVIIALSTGTVLINVPISTDHCSDGDRCG